VSSANSHTKPVGIFNRDRLDIIIVGTRISSVQSTEKVGLRDTEINSRAHGIKRSAVADGDGRMGFKLLRTFLPPQP
jgi:hypothetical protein